MTFFKEDIPEGFVSFGFMNESTEMYASRGMERTLSFLHLSLQEYLAAWHLADTFSTELQVAYHRLTVDEGAHSPYKGNNKDEEALLSSLEQQISSLVEPAMFLAGITGWKCQSQDDSHHWELYLSHDTAHIKDSSVLFCSLYEAQNPTILSHYFDVKSNAQSRRTLHIDSKLTPYNCYALSYSLAYSSVKLNLYVDLQEGDTSLLETFVKGLDNHRKSATPSVNKTVEVWCLYWLVKGNRELEEDIRLETEYFARNHLDDLLQKLDAIQFLYISTEPWEWKWISALKSLSGRELRGFHVTNKGSRLTSWAKTVLDVRFPYTALKFDACNLMYAAIDSILKTVVRSDEITEIELFAISRETMDGVRSILLHSPSLTTLTLRKSRLDDDGILYICSALRKNTVLRHLVIRGDLQIPRAQLVWRRLQSEWVCKQVCFLPDKTTLTRLLLELNNILEENATLEDVTIQCEPAQYLDDIYYNPVCTRTVSRRYDDPV